jgi:transcriptional regulator with XRE-family HTH domain
MSERKTESKVLIQIGRLIESKRKALGRQYKSREKFIEKRSDELFGAEDWISLRYLYNIEHGKNWISIEKLLLLSKALEVDPVDLFVEIVEICLSDRV